MFFGTRHDLGRDCSRCRQSTVIPWNLEQLGLPLRVEVNNLLSKNPHFLEGGGTLSLSLENIKFDTYADIGHVFLSVTRL